MRNYIIGLIAMIVLFGCSTRQEAPILKVNKQIDVPNYPKSVVIKGEQKKQILEFLSAVNKVRDHLIPTWIELTEPGASCNVSISLDRDTKLKDYSYKKCDFKNELVQTLEKSDKFPITEKELATLPPDITITLTNPLKKK